MIDFFGNLPEVSKDDNKITRFHARLTHIQVSKDEISELGKNICGRMKLTLPKSETHIIPDKEKPDTQRTRRGDSTILF